MQYLINTMPPVIFPSELQILLFYIFVSVDINECTEDTDNCDQDAMCTNTRGSFSCTCNIGFSGDGTNCSGERDQFTCDSCTMPSVKVEHSEFSVQLSGNQLARDVCTMPSMIDVYSEK